MVFSNKWYDILKFVTTIILPGLGTLYVSLAAIWGFPYANEISGTITALVLFLGVVLNLSNTQYRLMAANVPPAMPDERKSSVQPK